ncbi:MAG TPA: alpha/beta hydrolase [Acidimicrobiales bacterium]
MTITRLEAIDRGTGPTLLLLHGQPGSGSSWDPVTDRLADRFRVLAPDRPGYGSTAGEAQGIAANAVLAAALLEMSGTGPATVVAHSWAGGVGVLMADRYPHLVHGLVLVGAACTPDSLDGFDRLLALPVLGEALTAVGLLALGEVLPKVRRLSPRVPAAYRDQFRATLPDQGVLGGERGALGRHRRTFVSEQRALLDELPVVHAALSRLTVPTAVVVGAWDVVVRPGAGRTLATAIDGAELVEIARAGHFVARDTPDELATVIARYGQDAPVRAH